MQRVIALWTRGSQSFQPLEQNHDLHTLRDRLGARLILPVFTRELLAFVCSRCQTLQSNKTHPLSQTIISVKSNVVSLPGHVLTAISETQNNPAFQLGTLCLLWILGGNINILQVKQVENIYFNVKYITKVFPNILWIFSHLT